MLAPAWGLRPLLDIDDDTARENLSHVSVMAMSFVAQSARGLGQPMVPQAEIDKAVKGLKNKPHVTIGTMIEDSPATLAGSRLTIANQQTLPTHIGTSVM